ncbi:HAD family hydrolase [Microbacterium murale]|uniref:Haloacid dehalogenase n=1 Tax=Microbacterium murale TaxID=1081040 RepID=A0ABQ1RMG8_9MICO|nr:HAD family hydrolase [Microbacterium murale]GGD75450.1 haloacid dehalogenase [Microbacterium murale]
MVDRVYVFDLDDTLYLERDYVRSGFMHIGDVSRSHFGVDGVGEHAWSLFEHGTRGNTFDLVAAHFSLPPEATRVFIEEYRNHDPAIALQPDALYYLRNLPDDAVGTGVVTDGFAEGQRRKLRALNLDDVLDNIVVTGEHGPGWTKPSENAFRLIESKFAGREIEFVYFGDNPTKDFNAPHQLGWRTVRVRRPLGLHFAVDDTVVVDETISTFPMKDAVGDQARRVKGRLPQ